MSLDESDVNYRDSNGDTALHYIVRRHPHGISDDVVNSLFKRGVNDSIENNEGKNASQIAKENGYTHIYGILK